MGGGGVDGAIHSAAGPTLAQGTFFLLSCLFHSNSSSHLTNSKRFQTECRKLNGAKTGESKITSGHKLPAKYIIHTVGPIYSAHSEATAEALLWKCYQSALELTIENGCTSIVRPKNPSLPLCIVLIAFLIVLDSQAFSGISTGMCVHHSIGCR